MSLATVDDLQTFVGATFTAPQQERAQLLLDLATGSIQRFTRQTIEYVEDDVVSLITRPGRELVLPQVPVVDVTSVVVETVDTLLEDEDWIFDGHRSIWHLRSWGHERVTVTYSHGWVDIPDHVRSVCVQLAGRMWRNPSAVAAESVGQYSVTYGDGAVGLTMDEKTTLGDLRRKWVAGL